MADTLFEDDIISSTELKNHQKRWFDRATRVPVSITNTSGRQFVLINRDQIRNLVLGRDYATKILKYCKEIRDSMGKEQFVGDTFPWAKNLNEDDRLAFANELVSCLYEIIHTNNWLKLDEIISSWESTAEALTNPKFMEVVDSDPDKTEYIEVE